MTYNVFSGTLNLTQLNSATKTLRVYISNLEHIAMTVVIPVGVMTLVRRFTRATCAVLGDASDQRGSPCDVTRDGGDVIVRGVPRCQAAAAAADDDGSGGDGGCVDVTWARCVI